ncbi:MAG: hypothetical protein A2445_04085 [Candidatus Jacksonbacteria bacterium RIFOXYC2_FULL_44_29]|nr:MAG: hypothetical protein UV19_C0001G0038 [Parcubacteria group bacterium GW2011_GWA2_42_28]KKT56233.1 MAG: hypothetical protein UW45_C0001G0037 [Parcubacteria group bacterium GW2011_GWC2_44_22]OGY76119.1 MAG: hypothetical protein A2240_00305 [Candidatus Jacksonbacteria bacterium RIFOXYA2_FULL_43_12]OGY77710.1 MAG: hypothetical protein A2295_02805 [Candidatus Jacksonbacteria bacterium RIFOXYB2_FULL_44_15]OGY78846.1 MAG: hypothetical protein A2550_04870 [Candidatus Jacksonbacteria bacterium RI
MRENQNPVDENFKRHSKSPTEQGKIPQEEIPVETATPEKKESSPQELLLEKLYSIKTKLREAGLDKDIAIIERLQTHLGEEYTKYFKKIYDQLNEIIQDQELRVPKIPDMLNYVNPAGSSFDAKRWVPHPKLRTEIPIFLNSDKKNLQDPATGWWPACGGTADNYKKESPWKISAAEPFSPEAEKIMYQELGVNAQTNFENDRINDIQTTVPGVTINIDNRAFLGRPTAFSDAEKKANEIALKNHWSHLFIVDDEKDWITPIAYRRAAINLEPAYLQPLLDKCHNN